jgi:hypothetical protein
LGPVATQILGALGFNAAEIADIAG